MAGRRIRAVGVLALAAGALACSKTEDTAPERRIFGSPPSINSVEVMSIPSSDAICNWTPMAKYAMMCGFDLPVDTLPSPFPTITVTAEYHEVIFQAHVTDPESTPQQTDVLLVTASYISNQGGQPQETSLIVLDDGGANRFDFKEKADFYGENCTPDPMTCSDCTDAIYQLDSNDPTAGDGLYMRGYAFKSLSGGGVPAGNRAGALFEDCLVSKKRQSPTESSTGGQPLAFKFEAIDRSGNIAAWPVQPEVTIQPSRLSCTGDDCVCCLLMSSQPGGPASPTHPNPLTGCAGLPGLYGQPGSGYECGLCVLLKYGICP